jgi:acetyl-CoA decarbonylase/synthase complex subunit gamma
MALTGIQIYKLLPQTNCKECGFPTCLAFAMKLAAKQVELSACPYVTPESKAQLAESAAPPIRLVTLKAAGGEVKAGNEVVLYRHEKTFYNRPGIFTKCSAGAGAEALQAFASRVSAFSVNYVGIEFSIDGIAVEAAADDPIQFGQAVQAVRQACQLPLILISANPTVLAEGLKYLPGEVPLLYAAEAANWEAMADLARSHPANLAVAASSLDELADLVEKIKTKGVENLVLHPLATTLGQELVLNTQIRRLAVKKNFRSLGFPTLAFAKTSTAAAQAITKYAGFIVLEQFAPELAYPLLVLRQNIYTDPQKPIQVQPGIYEINSPKPTDPVLVTTNFSITYFSVANEVEGSGLPAWLLVTDAEGMSVLTAWAAGKFDAERIAKAVKAFNLDEKVTQKRLVIPGHVAVLSGELEEELPNWQIRVGPREAVDIPAFLKMAL